MNLEEINEVCEQYQRLIEHAHTLLEQGQVEDHLLSGSKGTKYLKQKRHRSLTKEDLESIINALGTEAEKKAIVAFNQAQTELTERLKESSYTRLILEQAQIDYHAQYYLRMTKPELWKPDQIIRIIEVLQRLRL